MVHLKRKQKKSTCLVKLQSEDGKLFFASVMNRTIKLTALTAARNK